MGTRAVFRTSEWTVIEHLQKHDNIYCRLSDCFSEAPTQILNSGLGLSLLRVTVVEFIFLEVMYFYLFKYIIHDLVSMTEFNQDREVIIYFYLSKYIIHDLVSMTEFNENLIIYLNVSVTF